jgi:L,D-transpeptidase YbiS
MSIKSMQRKVIVHALSNKLELLENDQVIWTASISISKHGLGEEPNSYKTPRGKHRIAQKIGKGMPIGTVFKSRVPTGTWSAENPGTAEDLILTRILWLEGLEEQNQTSFDRYIYFHGTNHEKLIGTAASQGCIRLKNQDMVQLFDNVEIGNEVIILED